MSYATYSAATGLPTISPNQPQTFNIRSNRDKVSDNKLVTKKMRLPKNSVVRSAQMYGTFNLDGTVPLKLLMPFTGNMIIEIIGGGADSDTLTIENPFVKPGVSVRITDVNANGGNATVTSLNNLITISNGIISIGGGAYTINDGGTFTIIVGTN